MTAPTSISAYLAARFGDAALIPVVTADGRSVYIPLGRLPADHPQRAAITEAAGRLP